MSLFYREGKEFIISHLNSDPSRPLSFFFPTPHSYNYPCSLTLIDRQIIHTIIQLTYLPAIFFRHSFPLIKSLLSEESSYLLSLINSIIHGENQQLPQLEDKDLLILIEDFYQTLQGKMGEALFHSKALNYQEQSIHRLVYQHCVYRLRFKHFMRKYNNLQQGLCNDTLYPFYTSFLRPLYPYPETPVVPKEDFKGLIVFYENYHYPWDKITQTFKGKTKIFIFIDKNACCRSIEDENFFKLLMEKESVLLFLDSFPTQQCRIQKMEAWDLSRFYTLKLWEGVNRQSSISVLIRSLQGILKHQQLFHSQGLLDEKIFYLTGLQVIEQTKLLSTGKIFCSFYWKELFYSTRQNKLPYLDISACTYLHYLSKSSHKYKKKPLKSKKDKIKIAHLVGQFINSRSNAPSQRVKQLLLDYDQTKYIPHLIISHASDKSPYELYGRYLTYYNEEEERTLLGNLYIDGIVSYAIQRQGGEEQSVEQILNYLSQQEIHTLIVHEAFPIHLQAAHNFQGKKIFMEHGQIPFVPFFDGIICSHAEEALRLRKFFPKSTYIHNLNKGMLKPFKGHFPRHFDRKKEYLFTFSNQLAARLSYDFLQLVARLLKRYAHLEYCLGGRCIENSLAFYFFKTEGLIDRVHYLGVLKNPYLYLEHACLYLNEFPLGGSMTILEAMACKCPIISLYSATGPMACREGAHFINSYALKDKEEYYQQACQLIESEEKRQAWGERGYKLFKQREASRVESYQQCLTKLGT